MSADRTTADLTGRWAAFRESWNPGKYYPAALVGWADALAAELARVQSALTDAQAGVFAANGGTAYLDALHAGWERVRFAEARVEELQRAVQTAEPVLREFRRLLAWWHPTFHTLPEDFDFEKCRACRMHREQVDAALLAARAVLAGGPRHKSESATRVGGNPGAPTGEVAPSPGGIAPAPTRPGESQGRAYLSGPTPISACICYPGMCPQGCEPACPYCFQLGVVEQKDGGE